MDKLFGPLGKDLAKFIDSKEAAEHAAQMQAAQCRPKLILGPGVSEADDFSKWACLYPHYIDQKLTLREGRRVNVEICEPYPEVERMATILADLGYRYVIEDKCYPRNYLIRGRIRVDVQSANVTKQNLLVDICHMLPTLPPRPIEEPPQPPPAVEPPKKQTAPKKSATKRKGGSKRR